MIDIDGVGCWHGGFIEFRSIAGHGRLRYDRGLSAAIPTLLEFAFVRRGSAVRFLLVLLLLE